MSITEFDVIANYFSQDFPQRSDVVLGVGDDAALCTIPSGRQLVIATDTLIENVHFPQKTRPEDIGYKALAVNLSDMAAMGATPAWMTLALTCPDTDDIWLSKFSSGLREMAESSQVSLIGGDTTSGPLTITIQIIGFVNNNSALQRDGAKIGDGIYVTGTVGDAGLGLASIEKRLLLARPLQKIVETRLHRPTPRLSEGKALCGIASSAIDISDGLIADLEHILTASNVGATIHTDKLPLSSTVYNSLSAETAWNFALSSGDDYELCFTVAEENKAALEEALPANSYTHIGTIEKRNGLRCLDSDGRIFIPKESGYEHFIKLNIGTSLRKRRRHSR
jgi:thiamine-monophosphate kinase